LLKLIRDNPTDGVHGAAGSVWDNHRNCSRRKNVRLGRDKQTEPEKNEHDEMSHPISPYSSRP
jgi:hypothetical protein